MSNINNHGNNNIINNAGGDIHQTINTKTTKGNTEEELFIAARNAQISLKLTEIREQYFEADWKKREDVLSTLHKYESQTNFLLAKEVFSFLIDITNYNRGRLPQKIALTIFSLTIGFFPSLINEDKVEKATELLKQCCNIAFYMAYENAIYAGDFTTVMYGLLLLKYAYRKANDNGSQDAIKLVGAKYHLLESELSRPQDKNYLEVVGCFKQDLPIKNGLAFPPLPENLMKLIRPEWFTVGTP